MVDRRRISVQHDGSTSRMQSVMSTLPREKGPLPCSSFSMADLHNVGLERRAWKEGGGASRVALQLAREGQGPPARMTGQRLVKSESAKRIRDDAPKVKDVQRAVGVNCCHAPATSYQSR